LAPEGRLALEGILANLPVEVFLAGDALGWVYQFWQKDKKDEVNASERKIGGADLGPVTQLFTENYMVRFLLENSLGAWWAGRHPDSPLIKEFEYLRFGDHDNPAAGPFAGWPDRVAEVTVMDPCCGSGHFLVVAFSMLWRMRAEEEGLSTTDAQNRVLCENLFGLELDSRCVQIAMFAVAVEAWRTGGGWRALPVPHISCSGVPVRATVDEWKALAHGNLPIENALVRLHILFREADTLGSLIDPRAAIEISDPTGLQRSFDDVAWSDIAPTLARLLTGETSDPATAVLGASAAGTARAADYLSREYTLVTTNVPYLTRTRQGAVLAGFSARYHSDARADLACTFLDRCAQFVGPRGTVAVVTPQNWLFLGRYADFRTRVLAEMTVHFAVRLGPGAFGAVTGEVVKAFLTIISRRPTPDGYILALSLDEELSLTEIRAAVTGDGFSRLEQASQLRNPDARITLIEPSAGEPLARVANAWQGIAPSDTPRFVRYFWEVPAIDGGWHLQQSRPAAAGSLYAGRSLILFWEDGHGRITEVCQEGATFRGQAAWGKRGVAVAQIGDLPGTLYTGEKFDGNAHVIVPRDQSLVPAIWHWVDSGEFSREVRKLDQKLSVTNATMSKVPFDIERWRTVAEDAGPLPEPWSNDPTQWLFEGCPQDSTQPLHTAVGRLVGYRWPGQVESDDLRGFADADGIVCLPSVTGEAPAVDRLQGLLGAAFDSSWSPASLKDLLTGTGTKKLGLADWLRDDFFKQHCAIFGHRPFVWHIWDGQRDGFAALVNYHRLDRKTLEKLTYTYLGDWIERQRAEVHDEKAGAEARLAAARSLQQKLELILEGEPPYDIYVRWKSLAEQPIGWEPDLNDGVRLNIRPFVEAGVLRSKFNVKWDKDRGKNPDGSERLNDLHYSHAEKRAARRGSA